MQRKPIVDANVEELKAFANGVLGIEVHPATTKVESVLAKIQPAWPHDYIMVDDQAEPSPEVEQGAPPPRVDGQTPAGKTPAADDPKVTVVISEQPVPGGKRPVAVGHNGVFMLIPRGTPQVIPYRYFLVLRDAVETQYSEDEHNEGEFIETIGYSYPFQVLKGPTEEEEEAWRKKYASDGEEIAA